VTKKVSLGEMQQRWTKIAEQSHAGSFTFEKESAAKAAAACSQLVSDLQSELFNRKHLGQLNSFGTFTSAEQARGHYEAQYTAWTVEINKCIEIATTMQLAFQDAGHLSIEQEDKNSSHIQQTKPGG